MQPVTDKDLAGMLASDATLGDAVADAALQSAREVKREGDELVAQREALRRELQALEARLANMAGRLDGLLDLIRSRAAKPD